MGTFLMLSGIANSSVTEVENALRDFATKHSGSLTPLSSDIESGDVLLIAASDQGNVTVLYPDSYLSWHEACEHLSVTLKKPVLSLHIHDGDFWMYVLLKNGQEIDRFNPIPDYWEELPESEMKSWAGNAEVFARHWPNVTPSQISNYLVRWDMLNEENAKAYPDDEFGSGEDWQLTDFMAKVGLVYPIDDNGHSLGSKYNFEVES